MWPRERLTPEPGARLTLSPNWRFHFLCSVQRSELARRLDLFIRIVNRVYLPAIFQDASEPVDPNRLGQPHGGSVPRHPRAMDVEGIVAEPPWLLQGAALWVLPGLVSGRTQSNGMNLPKTPFQGKFGV
jgi:hypothetical protein